MSNQVYDLHFIKEPELEFGYEQKLDNPKEGLFLFGPKNNSFKPKQMDIGVVGTKGGIELYKKWVLHISGYIPPFKQESPHHLAFPGFSAAFGVEWPVEPLVELFVDEKKLSNNIRIKNRHESINNVVEMYKEIIESYIYEEDVSVPMWFVIIPDEIFKYGRPKSRVPSNIAVESKLLLTKKKAQEILNIQPSLFQNDNEDAEIYKYDLDFHNQLKAKMLPSKTIVQIVRESTLRNIDEENNSEEARGMQDPASIAWNLCTTTYYKNYGQPWVLTSIRKKVFYIGLVFKKNDNLNRDGNSCCGAQLFMQNGDGVVFKSSKGDYYSESTYEFHIGYDDAKKLMEQSVTAYSEKWNGELPEEVVIHGKTRFNKDEVKGFSDSLPNNVKLSCIKITTNNDLKLYRLGEMPVLRGTALSLTEKKGYLWTKGYIPRLRTYPGREVPNPLLIEIVYGDTKLDVVFEDIMNLTKVNYNACIYADGIPVTLRFANAVGEIITAIQESTTQPLPFKHYI